MKTISEMISEQYSSEPPLLRYAFAFGAIAARLNSIAACAELGLDVTSDIIDLNRQVQDASPLYAAKAA